MPFNIAVGLKPLATLTAGAALSAALLRRMPGFAAPGTRRLAAACIVWLALSALNVALPMKFFQHYFYALISPLCLLAAILVASVGGRTWRVTLVTRVLAVLLLAAPPLRAIARQVITPADGREQSTELATACIRNFPASRPGLYVSNWDPILHETTRISPLTRYVLPVELAMYSESAGVDATAEIARILALRPGHLVIASPSLVEFSPAVTELIDHVVAGYELACSVPMRLTREQTGQTMVYRLR